MKLLSLRVENFRQFCGPFQIQFATADDRNVTVVYGANGAGKTTFLNAFTWCLYEKTTPAFEKHGHLINEKAWSEASVDSEVSCKVAVEFDHEERRYMIQRVTTHRKSSSGEPQVIRDSELLIDVTDESGSTNRVKVPDQIISQILPARLSSFFFFDGERIENLVKPEAYQEIQDAIKTVLGLEAVERAIKHLTTAGKKLESELKEVATPETQRHIAEKQSYEKETEAKREEKNKLLSNGESLKKEQVAIEEKLRGLEEAKRLQEKRDGLQKQHDENEEAIVAVRKELARKCSRHGYLAFSKGLFESVVTTLNSHREKGEIPSPIKRQFVEDLLEKGECICGTALTEGTDAYNRVKSWKERAGLADVEEAWNRLCAHAEDLQNVREDLFQFLHDKNSFLAARIAARTLLRQRLTAVGEALGSTESEEVRQLEERRQKVVDQGEQYKKAVWNLDREMEELDKQIKDKERQIQASQVQETKEKKARTRVQAARKAREIFEKILQLRTDDVRCQLDERIKSTYSKISYKAYVPCLNEDFHLELTKAIGSSDESVAKGTGENQILSLSFVGALADLARSRLGDGAKAAHNIGFQGGIYPIVMDSPFGSLDDNYREQVASAIPLLAPQVIVFVTKSQGLGEVRDKFAIRIGREAVITYFTPKPDVDEEEIRLDGRNYPYIRRSGNANEWAVVTEVGSGKK
jgi:DNA sulfur modification protein DndD